MSSSSSSSDDTISLVIDKIFEQAYLIDSESDEEDPPVRRTRRYIQRDREAVHQRLMNDYFVEDATFQGYIFCILFRMYKGLYERIVGDLTMSCSFFQQNLDARGILSFTPLQKCTVALRQIAYDISADALDESFRMSAKTACITLHKFYKHVIRIYGPCYLRKPIRSDIVQLQAHHANVHGFSGRLGSLDCMHWQWANCPTKLSGQYTRRDHGLPTVILGAVASQDEWIWHGFFGSPGSLNDINVLNRSPLFNNINNRSAPDSGFHVLGIPYKYVYYLVDGIYPEWAVFVKSWTHPHDEKKEKIQESSRES